MIKEIKPPQFDLRGSKFSVFLAGSIEMGTAVDWQKELVEELDSRTTADITVYNPRRDNWDSSWKQAIDNPQFSLQVNWEMDYLERADLKVFYFDKDTKSPITLLELGKYGAYNSVVYCPDGYWRKGNVDIFCHRENVPMVESIEELVDYILKQV
jgi:hypothetical protein